LGFSERVRSGRRQLDFEPDFLPPRREAPGEFAIFAARSFDMPFFLSPSYCFSFFTLGRLFGICDLLSRPVFCRFSSLETLPGTTRSNCGSVAGR
jgi:hypothetical protein